MWFVVGVLSHTVSACLLEELGTKVSHAESQPYLGDWTPVKTLNLKAHMRFPGWQHSLHIATRLFGETKAGREQPEAFPLEPS